MRAAWRIAISSLSARRRRTALLIGAVALSAALIVTVACAMASSHAAIQDQVDSTVGAGDVRISPGGNGVSMPASVLGAVRAWPEAKLVVGRLTEALDLEFPVQARVTDDRQEIREQTIRLSASLLVHGASDGAYELRPLEVITGRLPSAPGEIALDELALEALSVPGLWPPPRGVAIPGVTPDQGLSTPALQEAAEWNLKQGARQDAVVLVRRLLRAPVELRVVGVVRASLIGNQGQGFMTLDGLSRLSGRAGGLSEIDVLLHEGHDAVEVSARRSRELAPVALAQTTAKITSGLDRNIASSELGFVLAVVLSTLSAGFIILTGLATNVAERQRELAILRCLGGTRRQLATAQLLVGLIVGAGGGVIGLPLGVAIAAGMVEFFKKDIPTGLVAPSLGIALAGAGSMASGLIGAIWPAWRASRVSPMVAMRSQARGIRAGGLGVVTLLGGCGLAAQAVIVGVPEDGQVVFWGYATAGLPAMFIGYFLLGAPAVLAVSWAASGVLSRILGLPGSLLRREISATPFRFGLTAGAMMGGLALMVAIWTNGGAILRDWLGKLEFPDAFVTGLALTEESQRTLEALPFVTSTCAITLHPVETDAFGVRALQRYKTTFIAFEPDRFFRMTRLTWVQGDEASARARLNQGGAVIVSREFLIAQGLGVGDTFRCADAGAEHEFEIVGVVTSPGLDVVSKYFSVGQEYHQQALHAVFGSRADLQSRFNSTAIHMIQIDLAEDVDEAAAIADVRRTLFGAGVLAAGSGQNIKEDIRGFATGALLVFSVIAVVAMLVACFGVANLVVAGIDARAWEFGVLRAVGASRGVVARLVMGEAVIVALTAMLLGTLMGLQGSWAGQRLYALLLGLSLELRPPWGAIAAGWGVVLVMTLGAAGPSVAGLMRRRPRELLGVTRG